ncbi:MAG TPA: RidA family protein [Herbaspirillum sp.]
MPVTRHNPEALGTPAGQFSHVSRVKANELLFIAGQLSAGASMAAQCDGVFDAIHAALVSAGSDWDNVIQFTTYLTDAEHIPEFTRWRQENFPAMFGAGNYPPNTLLIISQLAKKECLIEVQTVAAV